MSGYLMTKRMQSPSSYLCEVEAVEVRKKRLVEEDTDTDTQASTA